MMNIQGYERIRKGDKKAFEILYKNYYPKMYAYSKALTGDREAAKDLVQESFVIFWENRHRILAGYALGGYLFKIIHSQCIKYVRKKALQRNFSSFSEIRLLEIELAYYAPDKNILGLIYFEELNTRYRQALEALPDQCRLIFRMSREKELKAAEIADQLNLSVRTVENQIYKALRVIKESLGDYLQTWKENEIWE